MRVRTCVECGRFASGRRQSCEVCGGLIDPPPGDDHHDLLGGDTVALPPDLLGPRADDALGVPRPAGDTPPLPADLLELDFDEGRYRIRLRRSEQILLGRDADLSPHAGYLQGFANISRRHVTVRLDDAGRAYVRDEFSTNWTLRDGSRLTPGAEWRLYDDDRLRLGAEVSAVVRLVRHTTGVHTGRPPYQNGARNSITDSG